MDDLGVPLFQEMPIYILFLLLEKYLHCCITLAGLCELNKQHSGPQRVHAGAVLYFETSWFAN